MAVRNDFTAGEVLAAADLNDTFAAKADVLSPTFGGDVLFNPDSNNESRVQLNRSSTISSLVGGCLDFLIDGTTYATIHQPSANNLSIRGQNNVNRPIPMAVQAGIFSTFGGPLTITFASGRFTQTPIIVVSLLNAGRGFVYVTARSASSFTVAAESDGGGALGTEGMWIAIQMLTSSAAG